MREGLLRDHIVREPPVTARPKLGTAPVRRVWAAGLVRLAMISNGDDKRRSIRRKVLKRAAIVFNNGSSTIACVVRNTSEQGARLVVESILGVPDAFNLRFGDGYAVSCAVLWGRQNVIGVTFSPPPEVQRPLVILAAISSLSPIAVAANYRRLSGHCFWSERLCCGGVRSKN